MNRVHMHYSNVTPSPLPPPPPDEIFVYYVLEHTTNMYRGRPWRYSVIPSTPDFPTEYQIRQNSNPAGLPVIAANWGPGFRARTIILTHMFKHIKQIRTPDARLTKCSTGNLYAMMRNMRSDTGGDRTRVIVALFILRVASLGSCLVLCECATLEVTSTLVNCN